MLRIEQAATATVGVPSVATHKCINNVHGCPLHDEWLRATFEPARTGWHGRRWHRADHRGRQSVVCDPTSKYPGRETCLPSLFPTTITISTPVVSASISTECLHYNQTFHTVAFTVDSVHSCSFVSSHHEHCTDTPAVDSSFTNCISVVSRSSAATGTTDSSNRAVRHRPCTTCSDLEGTENIGMVLRRSVMAGISRSAAIDFARDFLGKGFIRSQVSVLSERPNRERSNERAPTLCLWSIPIGCRTKAGTTDASVRVRGSSGGILYRCDERHRTSKRWRSGHETEQGQPTKPQGASVGGRPGAHVLSRSFEGATVQETTASVSAASCTVGNQQESEGRWSPTLLLQKPQFRCPTNISTPLTNPAHGLSKGVSVQPLTKLQGRLHDNQSNCCYTAEMLGKKARGVATDSNTVELQDCTVGEGTRCVHSNRRHKPIQEGVLLSSVPYLSSMKAFVIVLKYYVPLVILLLENLQPERTTSQQREFQYSYEREEEKRSVTLRVSARVGHVCQKGAKNWRYSFVWGP